MLVLSVLEGVDDWVDDGGGPGQHGSQDVEERVLDVVVGNVDQHQGEEADLEMI